jgi:hypothetical protein
MILLYNTIDENGNYCVSDGTCFWYGIRNHGGNDAGDTEGCPLTAYNKNNDTIYGRSDLDLLKLVKTWLDEGHTVTWEFINKNQTN